MMSEKPILFSGPMVKAILQDRKTMTRRVIKGCVEEGGIYSDEGWHEGRYPQCPHPVGSRLWVRETFAYSTGPNRDEEDLPENYGIIYREDWERDPACSLNGAWRPSIFMPRWASRINLEVTAVKVERVWEISEGDAKAEGCKASGGEHLSYFESAVDAFADLWDSINGKRPGCSWAENPWVWAYTFRRVK